MCDPTVGGGAFLLAAADVLAARGIDRRRVAEELLWGADVDPVAVAVTEAAVVQWAGGDVDAAALRAHLVEADVLTASPWSTRFSVVLGNPPFLSQLARATARRPGAASRFGKASRGYADTSVLFLLAALDLACEGGTVCLIQPASLLAARDRTVGRREIADRASVTGLWLAGERVFGAEVRVCAPVLRLGAPMKHVRRWVGAGVAVAPSFFGVPGDSWAPLARGLTAPAPPRFGPRTLAEMATATAGFRDEYYGLAPTVRDGGGGLPLVTAGLIDPAVCHWGRRRARFAGKAFDRPTVDPSVLEGAAARWVAATREPKVVVATQTRVVEAAVDVDGTWVPSVPTIVVRGDDLWRILAVLLAPPVTAWAIDEFGGTALNSDAVKLSARQVLQAPLPTDEAAWSEAAAMLQAAPTDDEARWRTALEAFAGVATRAYAADPDLAAWWSTRLPRFVR